MTLELKTQNSSKINFPNINPFYFFNDGGSYHIETTPLNCRANQWTSLYMIETSVVKELSQCFIAIPPENIRKPDIIEIKYWLKMS